MTDYQFYILQTDDKCSRCESELPKGTQVLTTEEEIFCQDCMEELEAKNL